MIDPLAKCKWIHQRSPEKPTESALPEKPAPFRASQIMRLNSATDILPNFAKQITEIVKPTSTANLPPTYPMQYPIECVEQYLFSTLNNGKKFRRIAKS